MRALIGPSVLLYLDTSRKVLSQKGVVSVENYFQNFYGGGGTLYTRSPFAVGSSRRTVP